MKRFEAYENNAGMLYLCVLEDDKCIHIIEGWEYGPAGNLREAFADLRENEWEYLGWDGDLVESLECAGIENVTAQGLYDEGLGMLIAEMNDDGSLYIDAYACGCAGERALGIEEE